MCHAYLTIPSKIVCNSSTGESLVGSNPFGNSVNQTAEFRHKLTPECEVAVDDLGFVLIDPRPQGPLNLVRLLGFQRLRRTFDKIVNPELCMRVFDTCRSLECRDWRLLATACQIQLLLHGVDNVWS